VTDHRGVTTDYSYDSQDRLTQADLADSDGPTVTYAYEYDPASNRSASAVTDHQAGTTDTTNYAYNDADQLTRTSDGVTFNYDDAGQLTGDSDGMAIAYDAGQRTTSIRPAGDIVSPVEMDYTGATQASRTAAGATAFTNTLLGVADETTNDATTVFTRDHEGTLASLHHPTDGTFYYLFDGLGSVIGLTDEDGALVNEYDYDPYGALTDHTEQVHNPWRYTGEYHDQQTGLYKIGERYLDPEHGRWTQRDPLEGRANPAMPGEVNPYTYVGCDPINSTDPTGLLSEGDAICGITYTGTIAALISYIAAVGAPLGPAILASFGLAAGLVTSIACIMNALGYQVEYE